MTIKIMYLVDQYQGPQAGTEGQLLQLLLHLDRSRYEPSLTLLRDTEYSRRNAFPCPVRVLGITKLASLRAIIGMFRYAFMLRRENYRLVHCFFNDSALIAPFFLWLFGIRVLVSRRDMGFWYTPGNLVVLRVVARFVDRYVANSQAVKRLVHEQERVRSEKITVIYNGYAPAREDNSEAAAIPLLTQVAPRAPVVGIVANLRPIKRIDTLVDAFALVAKTQPDARLVIVGDTASQQAESTLDQLQNMVAGLGLHDRVIFTGRVEAARPYIERFSVAVLCSESEGLSNSIIEYMQAGRAIVCTDTGGNPELVRDGHNGFLVCVGDSHALAERLLRLLSDPALAQRFGEAGYEAVRTYTHARMVTGQMTCYDDVLAARLRHRTTDPSIS
jgi:glycosyltransferase involved in cell wall biosynthesis